MNSHPYAKAIPSAFFSTTQAVIHANRRSPDDPILNVPYSEARAKVFRRHVVPQKSTPTLLIRNKATTRPSGKIVLEESGVTLTLGGQKEFARMPSYGRCAVVDGSISFENPTNIVKVEVKIEGHVVVRERAGNGNAKTTVLSEELVFWDAPTRLQGGTCGYRHRKQQHQEHSSSEPRTISPSPAFFLTASEICPTSLSFKSVLPSHFVDEHGERTPLPPSFSEVLSEVPGFRVGVNYAIIVLVTRIREQKSSLSLPWRSKTKTVLLKAPVEYLPRTSPSMGSPFPLSSNTMGRTPVTRFVGSIESRDPLVRPVKTHVYLPTAQVVPLTGATPFFISVTGSEDTIRPLTRGAAALPSFLPMESPSTDSLSSFAGSVLPTPIARQFPCLNSTAASTTSSFNSTYYRHTSDDSQASGQSEKGTPPKVRVVLMRQVSVDARAAGFGIESPLSDVLGHDPDATFFETQYEKECKARSHICKSTVIGEGIVYSTSSTALCSTRSGKSSTASWAGEVRVDPRLGIKTGGFQTRTLSVKDMLIVSISHPNLGRTSLEDFRQVIPLRFTTDAFVDS